MKTCAAVRVKRYFTLLEIQKIRNLVIHRGYVVAYLNKRQKFASFFPMSFNPYFQINSLLIGERDINQNLDS